MDPLHTVLRSIRGETEQETKRPATASTCSVNF